MARCREIKHNLSGASKAFECELIVYRPGFGILRYVIDRSWRVGGIRLEPGTVTYGFYWTERPYNLYWWISGAGETVGYYFNLVDSTVLSEDAFVWRDLVVDILVYPDGTHRVLDKEQLPSPLEAGLSGYIRFAREQVLSTYPAILREAAKRLDDQEAER